MFFVVVLFAEVFVFFLLLSFSTPLQTGKSKSAFACYIYFAYIILIHSMIDLIVFQVIDLVRVYKLERF